MKNHGTQSDFAEINRQASRFSSAEPCVVLFSNYDQALCYRKSQSATRDGHILFAQTVTTFRLLIEDWWGLFGDGRRLVTACERHAFLAACEVEASVVEVAGRIISGGLGTNELDDALKSSHNARTQEEQRVLACINAYLIRIKEAGLVEQGEALLLLPQLLPQVPTQVMWACEEPLQPAEAQFFAACPWLKLRRSASEDRGPARVADGVALQFAFPAGDYAWPRMLADVCTQFDSTVVACKRPLAVYERISLALRKRNITCAVKDCVNFRQTSFGVAYCAVRRFLSYVGAGAEESDASLYEASQDGEASDAHLLVPAWDRASLSDFLFSPFSRMSVAYAQELDAQMRGDRALTPEAVAAQLRANCEPYSYFEELCSDVHASILCGALEDILQAMPYALKGWKAQQLSAIACLREVLDAAAFAGLDFRDVDSLLANATVRVAYTTAADDVEPCVRLMSMRDAAALPPASCEALVAADMTSAAYSVADKEDTAAHMLQSLGVVNPDSALKAQRRAFAALENLPTQRFIVERPLNDREAEPTYACAVLEEFIDCYREDATRTDDIDNEYALPKQLQSGMLVGGEDLLYENTQAISGSQECNDHICLPKTGEVSAHCKQLIVLPRVLKGGTVETLPSLSPSQIESYLECPYKWFAQRRLRLDDLDEGFGPLEMGEFAHNCLHSFYKHFAAESGYAKVSTESLPVAREIMQDVLARHAVYQSKLKTRESRLIPTTQLEFRELKELEVKLMNYLDFEAKLLPNFHPAYLEFDVAEGSTAPYAGVKIVGTADRVDVDDNGRFAVIDYKGSLSPEYAIGARTPTYLGKVQALIYAQVLRRSLGLAPAAALYVCYGRRHITTGAYDGTYIDTVYLPNVNANKCSWPLVSEGASTRFEDLLDQTEDAISGAVDNLLAGVIDPCPASDKACVWCPVSSCPERKA